MNLGIAVGLLDFGLLAHSRQDPSERIIMTEVEALMADKLGFSRYWLAEHHTPTAAWANAEAVLTRVGNHTRNIRVGTGGTLLRMYDPSDVARRFRYIAGRFPGRVDLGIARGLPPPAISSPAVHNPGLAYPNAIAALLTELDNLCAAPLGLQPWLLGSTTSLHLAAALQLPFCLSLFHALPNARPTLSETKDTLDAVDRAKPQQLSVAVACVCGTTDQRAQAAATRCATPFLTPIAIGDAVRCAEAIAETAGRLSVPEIIVLNLNDEHAERCRVLSGMARCLGLGRSESGT